MLKKKQLACKSVNLALIGLKNPQSLVDNEISLFPKNYETFLDKFLNIPNSSKNNSIIYKALKNFIKISNNRENNEDILSEGFYLLQQASIKYFEIVRDINFEQFAIVHIRENIKSYINKYNKLNSSDKNELIHTAIKQIKKKSDKAYLTTKQINKLINYFNLDPIKGIKKIWQLESFHFENISLWKKLDNKDGFEEEVCITDKKDKSLYDNLYQSNYEDPAIVVEKFDRNKENILKKEIIKKVYNTLKKDNEKIIFEKRIYNYNNKFLKLKELSNLLNISIQRINCIEKKLKKKINETYIVEKKIFAEIN